MAEEIQTMAIPVMLQEAEDTGYVTEEALSAFEAERLRAQERIKHLNNLLEKTIISVELMNTEIEEIQQELIDKAGSLGIDLNDVFEAEILKAQEKIENLRRSHEEGSISHEQMEEDTKTIQQGMQEMATAFGLKFNVDTLS